MNNIAIAGLVGGGIGAVKGIIDQKEAQKYDPQAGTSAGSYISNSLRDGLGFAAIAAGGAGIAAAVKNPKAIAEAISGSKIKETKLYKAIIPGKDELIQNMKPSSKEVEGNINKKIVNELQKEGIQFSDDTLKAFKSFEKSKFSADDYDNLKKALDKDDNLSDVISNEITEQTKDIVDNIKYDENTIKEQPWYVKAKEYTKSYYLAPDTKTRNTRIAATVGTASALAVGGRYLSGGTLTTDRYGQKNIAGIPFI